MVPHLVFLVSYSLSLQLTAPKSLGWPEPDSSLRQVTQQPPSLHPSILMRPHSHPIPPFLFCCTLDSSRNVGLSPSLAATCLSLPSSLFNMYSLSNAHTYTHIFTLPYPAIIVFFSSFLCLKSFLYFSQSPFSPPSTECYRCVCVAFVAQLTAIQKPLLACHHCNVPRRRCTRTNLSSMEPALRKSPFILRRWLSPLKELVERWPNTHVYTYLGVPLCQSVFLDELCAYICLCQCITLFPSVKLHIYVCQGEFIAGCRAAAAAVGAELARLIITPKLSTYRPHIVQGDPRESNCNGG